jgi:pyrroline-5-carboxylate reductase
MSRRKTIGIIGLGNMGEAIIKNLKSNKALRLLGSDKDTAKRTHIKRTYHLKVIRENRGLAEQSDVVIIAVKPKDAAKLLLEIRPSLKVPKVVVSIMAGVTLGFIRKHIGGKVTIARVMPNMPAQIGEGISALYLGNLSLKDKRLIKGIFSSIGEVVEVRERDFDAVTAVSGSGPAYFFYLVELLMKTAVSLGLKKSTAERLAIKTAQGSTQLLAETGDDPFALRKKVTSKGGTTEAAFKLFKRRKLDAILREGIKNACKRSRQLRGG